MGTILAEPKMPFHSPRRLLSTRLLVAGIHPKIVQERLGHSRNDIAMDTYSRVIPGMRKPAAAKMDRLQTTAYALEMVITSDRFDTMYTRFSE